MNVSIRYIRQDQEVEEARRKYGDAAADMLRAYHRRNDGMQGRQAIINAGSAAVTSGNPFAIVFGMLKGLITGGEEPPTEEQLRNAGR